MAGYEYILKSSAFAKIILHAAKYPHCSINGVLLAKKEDKDQKKTILVDCIPLFHLNLFLTPMMEIALNQVELYCCSRGLFIAGYYQANEQLEDEQLNAVSIKVAERIQEQFKSTCVMMVNNQQISYNCKKDCLQLYSWQDGKWKSNFNFEVEEEAQAIAGGLMHAKAYQTLIDFDNHLDDISGDWSNPDINKHVQYAT